MSRSPVMIVGGGIAGLAAAIALDGRDCEIWEKAEAFGEVGAGLQLGPNSVRALQALGAWDAVAPIASSPPEVHMRDGLSGKLVKRLKLGHTFEARFGAPYRVARRADLHSALLSVAVTKPSVVVKLGRDVTTCDIHEDAPRLRIGATEVLAGEVIATDGVNSRIRQSLFPHATAVAAGHDFHRAMLDLKHLPDVELECITVWMYPQGHVVHYPVGPMQHVNIVAITPSGNNPADFFNRAAMPLQHLLQHMGTDPKPWPGLYVQPLKSWEKSGVMLLGDAAHGTLPYLAQGAAMALEDAAALKFCLQSAPDLRTAFTQTAHGRKLRTDKLHTQTLAAGRTYHADGLLGAMRNLALKAMPGTVFNARLSWIYRGA